MREKRVLVCGASGFLGRNIYKRLLKRSDLEVFGTYNTQETDLPNLFQVDLTKEDDVLEATKGFDVIIQAAAITAGSKAVSSKPYQFITGNVIMNSLLLQAAHENNVSQFIFLSCPVMYPRHKDFVEETDVDLALIHPKYYMGARLKLFVEDLGRFYADLGRTKFTAIRHPNIYGPHDKFDLEKSHVFGATITKVIRSQDDKVIVWGEGKEKRDLLYVSDLVDFVEIVVEEQDYAYEIFNIGSGSAISISDLTRKIIKISGRDLVIEYDKTKPTIDVNWTLRYTKAAKKFGWCPKVDLDEGIEKTIAWYKKNVITE